MKTLLQFAAAVPAVAPRRALVAGATLAAGAALLLAPARADAQFISRFAIRGEVAAGTMLSEHQRTVLGYDSAHIQAVGRLNFSFIDALSLQLSVANGFFFSNRSDVEMGRVLALQGGLRFEPMLGRVGRLFIDANAGYTLTGEDQRFMFDVGLGFEFQVARWLGLGPVVRYSHVVQDPGNMQYPQDAMYWSAGLSFALRVPRDEPLPAPAPPPPADTDRDGVIDPEDQCRTEPMGAHPDPARRGCPLRDQDNDGVFDPQDQCPTTPQGDHPDPERAGCPDGDDDSDTVLNHDDQCRTEPQGAHPDPARRGCPIGDRDHDTVTDDVDHCPDQPGAPHPDPNQNGCPGLVRVEGGQLRILQPVFFATNRDTILPRSFPVLTAIANALRATPEIRRISIEGHTDDVGPDARNQGLSERRAASVQTWLVTNGIDAGRVEAHGFGETRPLTPVAGLRGRARNDARAQNRRVEFRIVDGPGAGSSASGASGSETSGSGSTGTPAPPPSNLGL